MPLPIFRIQILSLKNGYFAVIFTSNRVKELAQNVGTAVPCSDYYITVSVFICVINNRF